MQDLDTAHMADLLGGDTGRTVLGAVLEAVGAALHDTSVRSIHRRGSSAVSVVHEVQLTDGTGVRRDRLYVTHASSKHVPSGAARVHVDGTIVHVWQFPDDPYLPALRSAVSRSDTAELLDRVGVTASASAVAIRTRSYRPARRAVVQVRPGPDEPPAVYLKLLGGREERHRRRRTRRLVAAHQSLLDADLPVPPVLEHDNGAGRVVLGALTGRTLRDALRTGGALPDPEDLAALVRRLHRTPLSGGGDPDGFADVTRHVALLRRELPERADDLDRLAAAADEVGGPRGTVHGDLHDGQVLLDADGGLTGLLDVDGTGTGHLAHDVGRLLAHVEAGTLAVPQREAALRRYAEELGAACADDVPFEHVARAAASAWVGLATGPLRVASPDWQAEANERLDHGLQWLARLD